MCEQYWPEVYPMTSVAGGFSTAGNAGITKR